MARKKLTGIVRGLYAANPDSTVSSSIDQATVKIGGFEEDVRHFGVMKNAGVREKQYDKGTPIFNYRQISAVSVEELECIAAALGVEEIKPEWLGANILLQGIPELTRLPPTTRIYFSQGPTVMVYGENEPCKAAGKPIENHYQIEGLAVDFVKKAVYSRGFVGWVEKEGIIQPGDKVRVEIPKFVRYNLPRNKHHSA